MRPLTAIVLSSKPVAATVGPIDAGGEKRERAFMTEPARSIGKLGFRKWYERRLIESHAWLITCFLCALAIAASLEGVSFTRAESIPLLVFVFVGGLVCWHALKRYRIIMDEAERLGESAVCGSCNTYASFRVLGDYPKMQVRCRKCGNEWPLNS